MENRTCRVCIDGRLRDAFSAQEMMFGTREEFDYAFCDSCETLQIVEQPADMSRYYHSGDYYSFNNRMAEGGLKAFAKRLLSGRITGRPSAFPRDNSRLARMKQACQPWTAVVPGLTKDWSILDVGCGEGARLQALSELGFTDLSGVDPYLPKEAVENAPRGVTLISGDLDTIERRFDLITMHHSLEHVPDPQAMLRKAASLLTDRGRILVRIPLFSQSVWDRFGRHWSQIDAPRHLYLFKTDGFKALATKAGLICEAHGFDSMAWSFAWSEAYRQGIPMASDGKPNALPFDRAQMEKFNADAIMANHKGDGDQGWFVLKLP